MITWSSLFETSWPKIAQILLVLALFFGFYGIAFAAGARVRGKSQNKLALVLFLGPAVVLALTGLGIPAIQTFIESFKSADSSKWVGFANYTRAAKDPDIRLAFLNTMLWIIIAPIVTTSIGLALATMLNKMKREALAKSLIWNLMYQFQEPTRPQTGLVGQIFIWLHLTPQHLLLWSPWNNFFLMVVYIWGTTGFGMVILSAAIKNIPADIEEAAQLDGASGFTLFRNITVPMVKTTIIVFDVIHTMTGGNFKTDVLSNRMFDEIFVYLNNGRGSALAVLIFLGVLPITYYNIRSIRAERNN